MAVSQAQTPRIPKFLGQLSPGYITKTCYRKNRRIGGLSSHCTNNAARVSTKTRVSRARSFSQRVHRTLKTPFVEVGVCVCVVNRVILRAGNSDIQALFDK